jgi:hypothetical protein
MMITTDAYIRGMFVIVNFLLGIYIVFYAYLFLIRTKSYPDRRPWEWLFVAAALFFIAQIFGVMWLYGAKRIFGMQIESVSLLLEFFYSVFILIAFITQSQLILNSDLIVISKKLGKTKPKLITDDLLENHELNAESDKKSKKKTSKNKKKSKKMTPDQEISEEFGEDKVRKEMEEEGFKPELIDE